MARGFAEFVADPAPAERFNYPSAYQALLGRTDVEVLAVPYSSLRPGTQAAAVLAAIGVDADVLEALPPVGGRPDRPGPVLIAASRLLFKRLWRLGLFASVPRARLGATATRLRELAEQGRWDRAEFWGFDDAIRDATIARFAASNDAFAQRVWGRSWTDWELGGEPEADLAALDPLLLVEVMRAVDRLVQQLQDAKRSSAGE
jgi:hypothetical protein